MVDYVIACPSQDQAGEVFICKDGGVPLPLIPFGIWDLQSHPAEASSWVQARHSFHHNVPVVYNKPHFLDQLDPGMGTLDALVDTVVPRFHPLML